MKDFSITEIIQAAAAVGALIVGIVTLRLVLVTLQAQLDLNRAQYDLLKIESNRAAREIRPTFVATQNHFVIGSTEYSLECKTGTALSLTIYQTQVFTINDNHLYSKKNKLNFAQVNPGQVLKNYNIVTEGFETSHFDLLLSYTDEDGRAYSQMITLDRRSASHGKLYTTKEKIVIDNFITT